MLHHLLAAVAGVHQSRDQLVTVTSFARPDDDRLHLLHVGSQALHERSDRRDQHPGGTLRIAQTPHDPQPTPHRLHRGRHALEWQRLPGRKRVDGLGTEEGAQIVGEPVRVTRGGHGHDDGTARREGGETGHCQGARRLGDGEHC